jgi:hypothetical protein
MSANSCFACMFFINVRLTSTRNLNLEYQKFGELVHTQLLCWSNVNLFMPVKDTSFLMRENSKRVAFLNLGATGSSVLGRVMALRCKASLTQLACFLYFNLCNLVLYKRWSCTVSNMVEFHVLKENLHFSVDLFVSHICLANKCASILR